MIIGVFALLLAVSVPSYAIAEPDDAEEDSEVVTYTTAPDYSTRLDTIAFSVQNVRDSVDGERSEVVGHLQTIENLLDDDVKSVEGDEKSEETKELEKIGKRLEGIQETLVTTGEEIEEQKPLSGTKAAASFTAYANASPSNQYALYAEGFMPRMGYKDHYIFLQDTSSSYVLVWGSLEKNGSSYSGNANWVRWYYQNNVNGYVQESGNGSVNVNPSGHVVLTDFEGYPMLGVENELFRKELGYYALVAVCVYSLFHVLGFTLRVSQHYT